MAKELRDRFESKLNKNSENKFNGSSCWEWTAARRNPSDYSYGCIKINGKAIDSHRAAWLIFVGPIPEGTLVLHKCDNKLCCNPDHLELGTYQKNRIDAVARGRCVPFRPMRTEPMPLEEIEKMRDEYARGVSKKFLAHKYNVPGTTLTRLLEK